MPNSTATAYHEAGHAVAARVQNIGVVRAAALVGDAGVHTRFRSPKTPAQLEDLCAALIIVDLAGAIAERAGGERGGAAEEASRTDEENAAARARRLVLARRGLAGDADLTAEMGAEAAELVDDLRQDATALVREKWPAIKRVAAALADAGELGEAEIDALIGTCRRPGAASART